MKHFLKILAIETIIIIMVGMFPLLAWGKAYWFEFICAYSISLVNAIVGYFLVISSFSDTHSDFYKKVYGGMLVRMAFVLGFTIFMISFEYVQSIPFFLSLMLFYTIHQWTEISGWLKELPLRKVQTKG
jgi:hypothetical protein